MQIRHAVCLCVLVIIALFALSATTGPTTRPDEKLLSPYSKDPNHLWNRLHRALFLRTAADGSEHIHVTDPLLYRGNEPFLLQGESHRRAVAALDDFLASPANEMPDEPVKRLYLQRDLWAAFDYVAWNPDEWVHFARDEPAAIELRTRLAKAIDRLALTEDALKALPDTYAQAVQSKQFAPDYDSAQPERPFLPANLFDPEGPWVRFHEATAEPMARQHYEAAGGRAAFIIFLRLPGGRAVTQQYLKSLNRDSIQQFPPGTMVAMVRRALAIDRARKVRVTPIVELVQMRVYRRIPEDPSANFHGDMGKQDVYEFVLDRSKLFAGEHALHALRPEDPGESFSRDTDLFVKDPRRDFASEMPALKSCMFCHQTPGIHSVLSLQHGLRADPRVVGREIFRTYDFDVELNYSVAAKRKQFGWGLLQGLMEANRRPDQ